MLQYPLGTFQTITGKKYFGDVISSSTDEYKIKQRNNQFLKKGIKEWNVCKSLQFSRLETTAESDSHLTECIGACWDN